MTQGGPVCRTPHIYERKLSTSKPRYKGGEKGGHRGRGIVYHRHDKKELNWEPGGSGQEQGAEFGSESGVFRLVRDLVGGALPAALEAVALAVHLQDVDVVGEPVQQRAGEPFRAEDLGPLVEGKVGGHHCGAPLVALAEDLEEQFRPGSGQGHEAQFVDDQQAEGGRYRCRLSSGISSLAYRGPLHIVFTGATPQPGPPPRFPSQGGCPGLTVRI